MTTSMRINTITHMALGGELVMDSPDLLLYDDGKTTAQISENAVRIAYRLLMGSTYEEEGNG